MVLDDVGATRLLLALEDHDGADLGHARGVCRLRAPLILDEAFGCRDRARRLAGKDQPLDRAAGEVDAHRSRLLRHPQRIGRGRADDGRLHAEDLLDARLGRHVSARQHQAADLLAGVVRAPEADEGAVAEGEENDVRGAHAEAPEAVAPHFGDPLPVLHAVQHLQWYPAGRSGGEVISDRHVLGRSQQRTEGRLFELSLHPFVASHHRDPAQVLKAPDRIGGHAGGLEPGGMPGHPLLRPGDQVFKLADLKGLDLVARHRLVPGIPVGRLLHGPSFARPRCNTFWNKLNPAWQRPKNRSRAITPPTVLAGWATRMPQGAG